ncbi:MAG TPA: MCP four helix bundle domain-containing protein, partial [Thermoanaerobaculia bacterium]|nr:MCP four helix bundle domain-containing protein [Thermoanaerobaculia bacterium]
MKWFLNLKVGIKLTLAFLLMSSIVAGIGIRGIQNMQALNEQLQKTFHHHVEPLEHMSAAAIAFQHNRLTRMEMVAAVGTPQYEEFVLKSAADMRRMDESLAAFRKAGTTATEDKLLAQLDADTESVKSGSLRLRAVLEDASVDAATREKAGTALLLDPGPRQVATRMRETFDQLVDMQKKDAEAAQNEGKALYESQKMMFLGTVVAA